MDANETFSVVDQRVAPFIMLDKDLIDKHGARLGPHLLGIYVALLRHAQPRARYSFDRMATLVGETLQIDPRELDVNAYILEDLGLIRTGRGWIEVR